MPFSLLPSPGTGTPANRDSGNTGIVSNAIRVPLVRDDGMKPRFEYVRTHWKPGFMPTAELTLMINFKLNGIG